MWASVSNSISSGTGSVAADIEVDERELWTYTCECTETGIRHVAAGFEVNGSELWTSSCECTETGIRNVTTATEVDGREPRKLPAPCNKANTVIAHDHGFISPAVRTQHHVFHFQRPHPCLPPG